MAKDIPTIVVTGGPKSDKGSILTFLADEFRKRGYQVEVIRRIKHDLFHAGKGPKKAGLNGFQAEIFTTMLDEEWHRKKLLQAAVKPLLLVELGAMDGAARIGRSQMERIWDAYGYHYVPLRDGRYKGVIHLTTRLPSAKPEDDSIRDVWMGIPHFGYISTLDPEERRRQAFAWAQSFIGPLEHERKYKLLIPFDRSWLPEKAQAVEIRQFYANEPEAPDIKPPRIRARGQDGYFLFFQTVKNNYGPMSCFEDEKLIDEERFTELYDNHRVLDFAEIRKTRWCYVDPETHLYTEVDVFHDLPGRTHIEYEVPDPTWDIPLPSWLIGNVKDVTDSKIDSNKALARSLALMRLAA